MATNLALISRNLVCRRYDGFPPRRSSILQWRRQLATVSASSIRHPKNASQLEQAAAHDGAPGIATLPASWYRSEKICQLEKRAIFSRGWHVTTVVSEFRNVGDYRVFDFAGRSVLLVKGRDGNVKAFHNVCRHRAYPLKTQSEGCSGVISCGYHAWTFDLAGNLIKAPQFDSVPGFDKKEHGLYPVHMHITRGGLIFVNLEASETPSVTFEEHFPGMAALLDGFDFQRYELRKKSVHVGEFNWKTRMDGYQECYHCQVAHKALSKSFSIKEYFVENHANYSQHIAKASTNDKDVYGSGNALFLFMFPGSALNCFDRGWQRSSTAPIDAGHTKIAMEYYVDPDLSEQEKDDFVESFSEVFWEDCALCTQAQMNLDAGVYERGVLHPSVESGVAALQAQTRRLVLEHAALEESLGHEVNPVAVRPRATLNTTKSPEDSLYARLEQREW
ncbi:ISP domain-containing protein [Calocera cornea HHB12733]|uniref:Choline monooxygenase, chloroplastic n=1 Tax=Calocera cornea HHB12733 TaxID=1353952 RepID=A0A165EA11_9BASI|nr:ISP domain-containing protein [Calocera cornea HHB12733]